MTLDPLAAVGAAAGGPDTTVVVAFAVGFVSFVSPCVLPLVPGYLSAVTGVTVGELRDAQRPALSRVLGPSLLFCLAFTVMFIALGMTATGLGSALQASRGTLDRVAGALIVALGVFFVLAPLVPRLNREWRPEGLISRAGSGGPLVAGLAFAFAWTPCAGPTLGAVLGAAATTGSTAHGGVLLLAYSLGLAVPFLLSALAFNRATVAFRWLRDRHLAVTAISGAVLVIMGVLIFLGELNRLNGAVDSGLSALGIDFPSL